MPEYEDVVFETFKAELEEKATTAEIAWETHYSKLPEFEKVEFGQFKERLRDHRKQVKENLKKSKEDETLMLEDRKIFPKQSTNEDGMPKWAMHRAKKLLEEDIAAKKHLAMNPRQLRETRTEYREFNLNVFRPHIYQQVRCKKFCNYLNDKREKKKLIHCIKPVDVNGDIMQIV